MGQLLQLAIGWRDFPVVQAIAVFTSVVVLALNLLRCTGSRGAMV